MSDSKNTSGGIEFVGLLTIVFVVLKLTKFIAWSWWWVLSPIWITTLIIIIILVAAVVIAARFGRKA